MRFKRFESRALVLVFLGIVWVGIASTITIGAPQQAASAAAAPTFSADVAPIFYAKCVSCHRPGEVAPMSLITFKDVRPWASSIRDKVTTRVMPPWHADRQYGTFRNEQSLTQGEIDTIVKWVNAQRARGRPVAHAGAAEIPGGLADRHTRRRVRDADDVCDPGDGRDRIPVLRGANQLH